MKSIKKLLALTLGFARRLRQLRPKANRFFRRFRRCVRRWYGCRQDLSDRDRHNLRSLRVPE